MSSPPRPPTAPAPPAPTPTVPPEVGVPAAREQQVLDALVAFARTLDRAHDVLELMGELTEQAVDLLAVSAAGVLLVDDTDPRRLTVAAASPGTRPLEVFAVEPSAGPGGECVRSGAPVSSPIIEVDAARWPRFARAAVEAGYRAVHVLPMRLRGDVVGAVTLLQDVPRALDDDDRRVGQTLADAATVGLLTHRGHRAETVAQQLRHALHRRMVVEQATGVLAQLAGLAPEEALAVLRAHARACSRRLAGVCDDVVSGALDATTLDPGTTLDPATPDPATARPPLPGPALPGPVG